MSSYIWSFIVLALVLTGLILGPDVTHISIRFFDSVLHLLGGIGLGFLLAGLANSFPALNMRKHFRIIVGVLILGIIWELFEAYFNISGYPLWTTAYYLDTLKDLIFDMIGAALVTYLFIKKDV